MISKMLDAPESESGRKSPTEFGVTSAAGRTIGAVPAFMDVI